MLDADDSDTIDKVLPVVHAGGVLRTAHKGITCQC